MAYSSYFIQRTAHFNNRLEEKYIHQYHQQQKNQEIVSYCLELTKLSHRLIITSNCKGNGYKLKDASMETARVETVVGKDVKAIYRILVAVVAVALIMQAVVLINVEAVILIMVVRVMVIIVIIN